MKIAPIILLFFRALALSAAAQAAPGTDAASPVAGSASPQPAAAVPAAILPNLHRIIRDLKTNADNSKSQENFGAQLWLVADARFFQDWRKPDTPTIDPIDTAVRGQPLYTVVVFSGPGRDTKGQSNVLCDFVVRRPDGSVYTERKDLAGYQAAAPADERMLILGRSFLNLSIGPDDPAGKYTVEATVRDEVAKVNVTLKKDFVVP